jgi:hypothetical protein
MQSDSNLGGGASGGESGGLGSSGLSGAGTGGSSGGGLGGSTGSSGLGTGTGGSTGSSDLGGTSLGGSTGSSGRSGGGTGGSTDGLGGSTGSSDLGGTGTGGSTGGLGGSTGGAAGSGFSTEGGGFTTGDDFDMHEGTYRRHYTATPVEATTPPVTTYEQARPAYEAGHRAAANPTYANRPYQEVEVELEREYPQKERFAAVKGYARHAFEWKTIVGALALAGGAWWVSRKLSETVSEMSEEEERDCRTFYESHPARSTVPYEQARTVYVVGYAAARNPDYTGRTYDDVEPHLRSGWSGSRAGSYDSLRDFTRRGYERGSSGSRSSGLDAGTSGSASFGGSTGGSTGGGTTGGTGGAL